MEKILLYIVAFFFVIGAIDYLEGNKLKVGKSFEDGIKTMGPLAISMIGILSITPLVSNILQETLVPLANIMHLDPSIFASSFIAVDMGAYNISMDIANSIEFAKFSGILMASILGCTLSFTLPLALGMVKEKYMASLTKGMLCGIATIPVGLFLGGVILKVKLFTLVINILPIIIISAILSIGIIYKPKLCLIIFKGIGKIIIFISIIGLIAQGLYSIVGVEIIKDIMPLKEAIYIVGKIAIFLAGAYVMLEYLKLVLKKPLTVIGKKFRMNNEAMASFIGSFASAIIVFSNFDKIDERGQVICSAFSVAGAYLLGGQLGYVASVEPELIGAYLITKIISGGLAIIFAIYLLKREEKNNN